MSASFSADDLRTLADVLDSLDTIRTRTGVELDGYGDQRVTMHDHVMRLRWDKDAGLHRVDMPDDNY